jgi:hypothetical protein
MENMPQHVFLFYENDVLFYLYSTHYDRDNNARYREPGQTQHAVGKAHEVVAMIPQSL